MFYNNNNNNNNNNNQICIARVCRMTSEAQQKHDIKKHKKHK